MSELTKTFNEIQIIYEYQNL